MHAVLMPRVVIESPLSASTQELLHLHVAYAKRCCLDSLSRGEAPYASHLLLAQPGLLNDDNPDERALGIRAGFQWGETADLIAVYTDMGISKGMQQGITHYTDYGIPVHYRRL